MSGPLDGVRILDLTRLLPGGYCTLLLADLGADVIKVEEPGRGDYVRLMPPLVEGDSAFHLALNRGKRSVTLNLKSLEGAATLRRLARWADALVESFRPGVLDELGVGYPALAAENERLVYVAISGYGQDGPYRDRVGHDVNYVGVAGALALNAPPGGAPIVPPVQVGDLGGGMAAAVGLVACLDEARRTGRGRFVDIAMMDVAFSWLQIPVATYLATGERPRPGGEWLTGGYAFYRVYEAGDGRFLAVGAVEPKFWQAFCEALSLPELAAEQAAGPERQEEVAARVGAVLATRPRDEWLARLEGLETCVGPVNDLPEALDDPQLRHRGMVASVEGRPVGAASPIRVSGWEPQARPAPRLGEHTEQVLAEAGLAPEEVAGLREGGAL
ncbi:MAG TPA: CaiB/BaiF CoA-transferase family protein [Actinomycetota bacterium]